MNGSILLVLLVASAVAVVFGRFAAIERRLQKLSRIEAKLDALLQHAGISFDAYKNVPAEVAEALQRGQRILAIKRFREATGLGLKEAKEYVDELARRGVA